MFYYYQSRVKIEENITKRFCLKIICKIKEVDKYEFIISTGICFIVIIMFID